MCKSPRHRAWQEAAGRVISLSEGDRSELAMTLLYMTLPPWIPPFCFPPSFFFCMDNALANPAKGVDLSCQNWSMLGVTFSKAVSGVKFRVMGIKHQRVFVYQSSFFLSPPPASSPSQCVSCDQLPSQIWSQAPVADGLQLDWPECVSPWLVEGLWLWRGGRNFESTQRQCKMRIMNSGWHRYLPCHLPFTGLPIAYVPRGTQRCQLWILFSSTVA